MSVLTKRLNMSVTPDLNIFKNWKQQSSSNFLKNVCMAFNLTQYELVAILRGARILKPQVEQVSIL